MKTSNGTEALPSKTLRKSKTNKQKSLAPYNVVFLLFIVYMYRIDKKMTEKLVKEIVKEEKNRKFYVAGKQ